MHLEIEVDPPYIAGAPVTFRAFTSNPMPAVAVFSWRDGCIVTGSVVSERRELARWPPADGPEYCTQALVGFQVPANTSALWLVLTFDTHADEGCIHVDVSMRGYPVSGSTEACPGPIVPAPEATPMALMVSAPSAAAAGESVRISATVRTLDGLAAPGIQLVATLGAYRVAASTTGPSGTVDWTVRAPEVGETTVMYLEVNATGYGWRTASDARRITIFPSTVRYLVLSPNVRAGDILQSGGKSVVEVLVRGSDGGWPVHATLDVETNDALALIQMTTASPNRYVITLRAVEVNESRTASVRVVASAPGYEGAEGILDYYVLAASSPPSETHPPGWRAPPWGAFAALGVASVAGFITAALLLRKRIVKRR